MITIIRGYNILKMPEKCKGSSGKNKTKQNTTLKADKVRFTDLMQQGGELQENQKMPLHKRD